MPNVVTPEGRLLFLSLFKPRTINGEGKPKYQATIVFDKAAQATPQFKALKKAAMEAAEAKWGSNVLKKLKSPFKTADDLDNVPNGIEEGDVFIRMNSPEDMPPGVVDSRRQRIIDQQEVYSGCYGMIQTHPYAWEHPSGGKGVSFGLDNLMKTRDGEPLSGRPRPEDAFAGVTVPTDDDGGDDDGEDFL